MKTLLLDIDYTLFCEDISRPYLKEFLEEMQTRYRLCFYTARTHQGVTNAIRIMWHQLGMDQDFIRDLQRSALTRESCPMIRIKSGAEIKCLIKASEILKVASKDVLLLDDNPSYDNPMCDHIIQAEGFMGETDDDYLIRVIPIIDEKFKRLI